MGYGLIGAMASSIFSSQLKNENIKNKTLCTLLFGSVHIHCTFHLYGTWSVSFFHCVTNFTHKMKFDLTTKHQTLKMLRLIWNTTSYNQYHKLLLLGKMRKELLIKYQDIQRCLLRRGRLASPSLSPSWTCEFLASTITLISSKKPEVDGGWMLKNREIDTKAKIKFYGVRNEQF